MTVDTIDSLSTLSTCQNNLKYLFFEKSSLNDPYLVNMRNYWLQTKLEQSHLFQNIWHSLFFFFSFFGRNCSLIDSRLTPLSIRVFMWICVCCMCVSLCGVLYVCVSDVRAGCTCTCTCGYVDLSVLGVDACLSWLYICGCMCAVCLLYMWLYVGLCWYVWMSGVCTVNARYTQCA